MPRPPVLCSFLLTRFSTLTPPRNSQKTALYLPSQSRADPPKPQDTSDQQQATMSINDKVAHMHKFYAIYGKGLEWSEAKPLLEEHYSPDVVYDLGADKKLGFDDLMGFAQQAIEAKAVFRVEKIEERPDGRLYASGWMEFPGVSEGQYVESLSRLDDEGAFVHIENVNAASGSAAQRAFEKAGVVESAAAN